MRFVHLILATLLLAACQSMPPPDRAKTEVSAVMQKWIDGMSHRDVESVVALYDSDAVLWGTRSPKLRDTPELVREYFNNLPTLPPSYKVTEGEHRIRVYGDMAISSGSYTFSEMRDGKEVLRPARFSFVYRYRSGHWLIVDHHSSVSPL